MNCLAEQRTISNSPELAGTMRFLLGLFVIFLGLFLSFIYAGQGQGLGFVLLLLSPFIVLTDKKAMN